MSVTRPRDVGRSAHRLLARLSRAIQRVRCPSADVFEDEASYLVIVDVPGVSGSDLEVRYLDGQLAVEATRERLNDGTVTRQITGRCRTITGRIALPSDAIVDAEAAHARLCEDGTMRIDLPKDTPEQEEERGERIQIDS